MSVIRNGRNHMTIVARAWDPPAAGKYVLATRKPLELGAVGTYDRGGGRPIAQASFAAENTIRDVGAVAAPQSVAPTMSKAHCLTEGRFVSNRQPTF